MNSHSETDFERLVALFERRIYNVALGLASNADQAADLTQETFLRAFRGWAGFRRQSQTYTWLYRILVNLNKDRLAREARKRERETDFAQPSGVGEMDWPDLDADPLREVEQSELRRMLMAAIDDLPHGYRDCVVLRDMEGLSYDEIAEVLGVTTEAVRSRLARARQQLRQRLTPYIRA